MLGSGNIGLVFGIPLLAYHAKVVIIDVQSWDALSTLMAFHASFNTVLPPGADHKVTTTVSSHK